MATVIPFQQHDRRSNQQHRSDVSEQTSRHAALSIGALLVAISAYGGAVGLCTGALRLGGTLNDRLPLDSPVLGGAALAILVGVPFSALAWLAWRADPHTPALAYLSGLGLIGWIAVELAFVREVSLLQVLYVAVGAAFALAGQRIQMRASRLREQ